MMTSGLSGDEKVESASHSCRHSFFSNQFQPQPAPIQLVLPPSFKMNSGVNAIQRHEIYVLDDGEKPLTVLEDTKIPNAATIVIVKQDHTLANMLRHQLLANPSVLFAGYKVPHPLQPSFQLKIQTDGTITPAEALERASSDLIGMLGTLETKFRQEFSFRELEGADVGIGLGVGTGAGVGGLGGVGGGVGGTGDVGLDGTAGGAYGEGAAWSGRDYLDL